MSFGEVPSRCLSLTSKKPLKLHDILINLTVKLLVHSTHTTGTTLTLARNHTILQNPALGIMLRSESSLN